MNRRRVNGVQNRLNRFPYRYEAIDDAYARFLGDGSLPDDNALAWRVLKRVLHARKPLSLHHGDVMHATGRRLHQPCGNTREMLFREACSRIEQVRAFARTLLKTAVSAGYDPTDADLIKPELEPIDYGTISLQLFGWPQEYVRPEYRQQLDRVLEQQAADRVTRPAMDDEWARGAGAALSAFLTRGLLPTDPRFFGFALTTGEIFALCDNYIHGDGEDLIAAYANVAASTGEEYAAALRRLGALQANSACRRAS